MAKNNLVRLAKNDGKKLPTKIGKPTNLQDKKTTVPVEKPKTPEEERDIKAKKTVEKLLEDVDLEIKKEDEIIEFDTPKEGTEWLEEQVSLLSQENEKLRNELATAKEDYTKLYQQFQNTKSGGAIGLEAETINQNILMLFNELQNNLLGANQERTPWQSVKIVHLLNEMTTLFPFTLKFKRF